MGGHLVWCRVRDSNPRTRRGLIYSQLCLTASLTLHCGNCINITSFIPAYYRSNSLLIILVEPTEGFEPTTRCLQNSRSSHWAMSATDVILAKSVLFGNCSIQRRGGGASYALACRMEQSASWGAVLPYLLRPEGRGRYMPCGVM